MININAVNSAQRNWPTANQRPAANGKEPLANRDSAGSGGAEFDRFIKSDGKPEETPGLYRVETDESGKPKIVFDSPEAAKENTQATQEPPKTEPVPDTAEGDKKPGANEDDEDNGGQWGTVNTDRVDAEIKQLKEKVSQLERQLQRASKDENTDERRRLEAQLSQANAELSGKDNEAYRKANAVYSFSKERPAGA